MRLISGAALATVLAMSLGASPVHAQTSGPTLMTVQDLRTPAQDTANTAGVWADEIQANNTLLNVSTNTIKSTTFNEPFRTESAVFHTTAGVVFATVAESGATCQFSVNSPSTTAPIETLCMARVATIRNGQLVTSATQYGCYIDVDDSTYALGNDAAYASYDASSNSVTFGATHNGNVLSDCALTIAVP